MCTTALNVATGEEIDSIGDLRRIAPIVFAARGLSEADLETNPDGNCMCQADVVWTLVVAGFKVWANPDVLPEFLFEPVAAEAV